MEKVQRGFSLIEGLISLFLFLMIALFSFECFRSVRAHFSELKESETDNTAAYAALDRMRRDLRDAGLGLETAMTFRVLECLYETQEKLVILSKDQDIAIEEALTSGQQRILTPDAPIIKRGHQIGIFNDQGGEIHSVSSVDQQSIVIESPLESDYLQEDASVVLLRKITLYFDEDNGVIRRKVNASPAQPLLESVALFEFEYAKDTNLVNLGFILMIDKEKNYETTVFPKNIAMASALWEK